MTVLERVAALVTVPLFYVLTFALVLIGVVVGFFFIDTAKCIITNQTYPSRGEQLRLAVFTGLILAATLWSLLHLAPYLARATAWWWRSLWG